jgi:predicted methyltransferase
MKTRQIWAAVVLAAMPLATSLASPATISALRIAVADPHRSAADRARDRYRHPAETLAFFGVHPGQTVVEFLPSGGWYTAILAPLLSGHGHYVGLVLKGQKAEASLASLLAGGGERYRGATAAVLDPATGASTIPDGSADVVLTFRNIHDLVMGGGKTAPGIFRAFYRMLKPGGVLGVVDHHLPETMDNAAEMKSGYLKRSRIVRLAQAAGFRLVDESAINANPKDTHDWPAGVWTLPPTLRRGDADRARYLAIGESDRMTLKFIKPR